MMAEALENHDEVVIVRFNPWLFESQAKLLQGFFTTLADALGKSLPTRIEELGKILNRYGAILSAASIDMGNGVQISAGSAIQGLGQSLSMTELDDLKARLEGILGKSNKRIVVLMDDIDRLDRHEIHAMFKLVKLSAGFERTSYVLAFDDDVVAAALGEQYAGGDKEAGRNFLEKIVQVPLHLPPGDQLSLRKFTFEGVEASLTLAGIHISGEQGEAFVRHFVDGLELRLTTPRQAKRYANAIAFALPILKGEVNPIDQMLIEGIRVFFPVLYKNIRENPDIFLCENRDAARDDGLRKRATEVIDNAMKDLSPSDRERVRRRLLEVLFPRLKSVFGNVGFSSDFDEGWDREQRICSRNYFDRYFRYAVTPGDVPDLVVEKLLDAAASDDLETEKIFKNITECGGTGRLIQKLRRVEDKVERPAAERIALLMARNAGTFPREKGMFLSDRSFSQGAILLMKLLWRVPEGKEREELARRLVGVAEPLVFGAECVRWFRHNEKEPESKRLIPAGVEDDLGRILAGRVKDNAEIEPPYLRSPGDTSHLLWIWNRYGKGGEVRDYLHGRFDTSPKEIDDFLSAFVPTAWGMESGLSHKSDFDRDAYNNVIKMIEPKYLFEKLKDRYGGELDTPDFYEPRDGDLGRRIANQFAFVHRVAEEESRKKAEGELGDARETPQDEV
jgi:hypothetical protein